MKTHDKIYISSCLIIFLVFISSLQAFSTTYYVSTDGNDTNSGTSQLSSWQTLNKVNSFLFQAGDSILFKRDNLWRGQLIPQSGNSGNCIYYGAYDSGEKPIFLGSVNLADSSFWVNTGGNIWSTATATTTSGEKILNPSFDIDAANWSLYSQGTAIVSGARNTVDFASAPASYKINCTANGDNYFDIQLNTQGLSIDNGKIYRLSFNAKASTLFRPGAFLLMKSSAPYNLYYSNIVYTPIIDTVWTSYTVYFHSNITASDAMINFFLGDSLANNSILFLDDISLIETVCNSPITMDVGNIIFNNASSFGVRKWLLSDLQTQGDYCYDKDSIKVKLYSTINPGLYYSDIECALTQNIINEENKSYIVFENLALKYGSAHGIGGGNTNNITIKSCEISFIGGGRLFVSAYGDVRFGNGIEFWGNTENNLVERCKIWEIYDAALTNQNRGSIAIQKNIIYRNNLIYNAEWSFEYWNRPATSLSKNIYFVNNTCLYAGNTWAHSQREDKRGRHVNFFQNDASTNNFYILNNIFYKATSACLYVLRYSDLDSFNLNNNCWYQSANDTLIDLRLGFTPYDSYTMSQFTNYQNDYQQDQNSIAAYPMFTDTTNNYFQIPFNSPCIDAGTVDTSGINVGETDFFGNIRLLDGDNNPPAIIDIGCFEYEYTVGIENNDSLKYIIIRVYPNPSNGIFHIDGEMENIKVFNTMGQIVLQSKNNEIDLSSYPKGIYYLKLKNVYGAISEQKVVLW